MSLAPATNLSRGTLSENTRRCCQFLSHKNSLFLHIYAVAVLKFKMQRRWLLLSLATVVQKHFYVLLLLRQIEFCLALFLFL